MPHARRIAGSVPTRRARRGGCTVHADFCGRRSEGEQSVSGRGKQRCASRVISACRTLTFVHGSGGRRQWRNHQIRTREARALPLRRAEHADARSRRWEWAGRSVQGRVRAPRVAETAAAGTLHSGLRRQGTRKGPGRARWGDRGDAVRDGGGGGSGMQTGTSLASAMLTLSVMGGLVRTVMRTQARGT